MVSERRVGAGRIELVMGNIVTQRVEAIVNAANTSLLGGGGVDGAIHRAAGPTLLQECRVLPVDERGCRCPTGEVRVTGAGALPARHVIHAVGPVYDAADPDVSAALLRKVHEGALAAAVAHGCRSVAFPAISTGVFGYPIDEAAGVALDATARFLAAHDGPAPIVRFVLFGERDYRVFEETLGSLPALDPAPDA